MFIIIHWCWVRRTNSSQHPCWRSDHGISFVRKLLIEIIISITSNTFYNKRFLLLFPLKYYLTTTLTTLRTDSRYILMKIFPLLTDRSRPESLYVPLLANGYPTKSPSPPLNYYWYDAKPSATLHEDEDVDKQTRTKKTARRARISRTSRLRWVRVVADIGK